MHCSGLNLGHWGFLGFFPLFTPDRPDGGAEKGQWNQSASGETPATALIRRKCFVQSLHCDHLVLVPFLSYSIQFFSLVSIPFSVRVPSHSLGSFPSLFIFFVSISGPGSFSFGGRVTPLSSQHPHGAVIFRLHRSFPSITSSELLPRWGSPAIIIVGAAPC